MMTPEMRIKKVKEKIKQNKREGVISQKLIQSRRYKFYRQVIEKNIKIKDRTKLKMGMIKKPYRIVLEADTKVRIQLDRVYQVKLVCLCNI